jgi:hypothetical protein
VLELVNTNVVVVAPTFNTQLAPPVVQALNKFFHPQFGAPAVLNETTFAGGLFHTVVQSVHTLFVMPAKLICKFAAAPFGHCVHGTVEKLDELDELGGFIQKYLMR